MTILRCCGVVHIDLEWPFVQQTLAHRAKHCCICMHDYLNATFQVSTMILDMLYKIPLSQFPGRMSSVLLVCLTNSPYVHRGKVLNDLGFRVHRPKAERHWLSNCWGVLKQVALGSSKGIGKFHPTPPVLPLQSFASSIGIPLTPLSLLYCQGDKINECRSPCSSFIFMAK